jgi:hypothetical protein
MNQAPSLSASVLRGSMRGKLPPYKARTLGIFLRKIAYDYVRYGYTEYAVREIPVGVDEKGVWEKLLREYEVTYCHMRRARRRREEKGNVALITYGRTFVLMGSPGEHGKFGRIVRRNIRTSPIHFGGYSVGVKGGVPEVRVGARRWKRVEDVGHGIALHDHRKVTDFLHRFLERVSPYRFSGVVRQKEKLLREVNE